MMNEVLYEQIDALEKKLIASRRENDRLKKENDKLKKALKKDQPADEATEPPAPEEPESKSGDE
jgi:regulator of replication initiation timing